MRRACCMMGRLSRSNQLTALGSMCVNGFLLFGFEAGAERGDAVLDKVEARALHDVVLGVVGGGDDFFGDTEGGADFCARKFAVLEELKIGAGELRFHDFGCAPKQD